MVTVFTTKITNRLRYIFELYFEDVLNVSFRLTDQKNEFEQAEGVRLNYSELKFAGIDLNLRPHALLFETDIRYHDLKALPCNEQLCFFHSSKDSFVPFDPFAAAFFLVTRYEEYLERQFGSHGRYPAKHSILYRNKVLDQPVVNQWARLIAAKISEQYPDFGIPKPAFQFLTTVDVDNAWAYKNKSVPRIAGASIKSLVRGRFGELIKRFKVWAGSEHDPFDTYAYMKECYKGMEEHLHFFFLLGKGSKYDRNISPENKELQELIRELNTKFAIGIHPSYRTNQEKEELLQECRTLEKITGKPVIASRQHFLKLLFPQSYRRLLKAGIKEDYTLGYAELPGFRAGIATPYFFFDLKDDRKTDLRLFPFQFMDVTLRQYMNLPPQEALVLIEKMMTEVKKCGGTFISLWHNESLSDVGIWEGWRDVFEAYTAYAIALKNG